MLMADVEGLDIIPNAVLERTMVAPFREGLETELSARSTILIWIVWLGMQVLG